jgi:flagellar biosynthetic protein FliR
MVVELASEELFRPLLVLVRVGAALLIMPGFGEPYVLGRFRLLLALLLSLSLVTPLAPALPAVPASAEAQVWLIGSEVTIGLFLGLAARVTFAALHIGGTIIAYQSGLAAAAIYDPNEATTGTLPGNFLTTTALALLFALDGHHGLLRALAASYASLPPGQPLPIGDLADALTRLVQRGFAVGLQIAAPMIVVGLLLQLLMGVLNRLMPSFPVFFVAMPLQLVLAFATLMLTFAAGLLVLMGQLDSVVGGWPPTG